MLVRVDEALYEDWKQKKHSVFVSAWASSPEILILYIWGEIKGLHIEQKRLVRRYQVLTQRICGHCVQNSTLFSGSLLCCEGLSLQESYSRQTIFKLSFINFASDISLAEWGIYYKFGKSNRQVTKKPYLYVTAKETIQQNLFFFFSFFFFHHLQRWCAAFPRYQIAGLGTHTTQVIIHLDLNYFFQSQLFQTMHHLHFKWQVKFYHHSQRQGQGGTLCWTKEMEKRIDSTSNLQYPWGRKNC